ncbi:DNA polymerase III subunit delta' [Aneurinibacillus sp. Ricciae_BoGa-3]|uniref:DNA polymerase III subunit delta' n=1 Tax=Aneurinibacillus sp. Ricciae_BoGa-3 TaxID=3022697 RepID=UPI00233FFF8F|nr:DNA polymerase III subunit delta' [Aneurinibacillus sp. Ricciae_BoGa-3]WCK54613.1 DNA polymerase III subunit delta' [Aneurinibacillus sp. Ricciae_BoGa-3]
MWQDCYEQKQIAEFLHRSIQNDRLAHAYLFAGAAGSGKRDMAVQLAKAVFCQRGDGNSCETCENCRRIASGNHPDVHRVAPEGTRIKIKQIEELQKEFSYRAMESQHKVYIMVEADKMTTEAANRLLKFLEEPPKGVVAILLTEQASNILPTILSRCQVVAFPSLPEESIVARLEEEGVRPGLARAATAVSFNLVKARELCEAEWFAQFRILVIQLTEDIMERGSYALVSIHDKLLKADKAVDEIDLFLDLLVVWLRDLLLYLLGRESRITNIDQMETIARHTVRWGQRRLVNGMGTVLITKNRLSHYANLQLSLEDMVLRLQEG